MGERPPDDGARQVQVILSSLAGRGACWQGTIRLARGTLVRCPPLACQQAAPATTHS